MRGFVLMCVIPATGHGFGVEPGLYVLRQWSYENGEIHYGWTVEEDEVYLMDENGWGIRDTLMEPGDDMVDPWAGSQVSDFEADSDTVPDVAEPSPRPSLTLPSRSRCCRSPLS